VALNGFRVQATIIQFKSVDNLFSFMIDLEVPSKEDISKFDTAAKFFKLKKDLLSVERFRNVILLLPFIAAVLFTILSSFSSE
jgi:hypothetical protein